MRMDRRIKFHRLMPPIKKTSGTTSARTIASGGKGGSGVMDTQGIGRIKIEITRRSVGSATTNIKSFRLHFASGAATLAASAHNASGSFSGVTSGIVLSAKTGSTSTYGIEFDLTTMAKRKRYMNCTLTHSGTSATYEVRAYGLFLEGFPPSTSTGAGGQGVTANGNYTAYSALS